jgi:hypothetical protein
MDRRNLALLEALKAGALQGGEMRLYRRGKLPGLFAQRTRLNADIANQAVKDGMLEVMRVEPVGKINVEWVRVTQKGLDYLLERESPARALMELREALAVNQQGLPIWADGMYARIDDLVRTFGTEVEAMRQQLQQLSLRVEAAIERLEAERARAPAPTVPWAQETLQYLDERRHVGLGTRCPLADLFGMLKTKHDDFSIKDFHAGLKRLREGNLIALLPSNGNGDTPGPEFALLDGAAVYYYAAPATTAVPQSASHR